MSDSHARAQHADHPAADALLPRTEVEFIDTEPFDSLDEFPSESPEPSASSDVVVSRFELTPTSLGDGAGAPAPASPASALPAWRRHRSGPRRMGAATVRHLAHIWAAFSQLSSRVVRAIGAATVRHLALSGRRFLSCRRAWCAPSARPRCVTSHSSGRRFLSCRSAWRAPSAPPRRAPRFACVSSLLPRPTPLWRGSAGVSASDGRSRRRRARQPGTRRDAHPAGLSSAARARCLGGPHCGSIAQRRSTDRCERAEDRAACRSRQPGRRCHALTAGISFGAPARGLVSPHCVSTAERRWSRAPQTCAGSRCLPVVRSSHAS